MNITLLGAHNTESHETGYTCLVIDDIIAIDAGGLTASLSFAEQRSLKAILLTHQHYDHIRDIPGLAMNLYASGDTINIYGIGDVYVELTAHLLNGVTYPNFLLRPPESPTLRFIELMPDQGMKIEGYVVLPVPVVHGVPAIGYQVTSPEGKSLFYTGDTGPDLEECWQQVAPHLLVVEVTLPNDREEKALEAGHLTPALLKQELLDFRKNQGYLPQIVTVHMDPGLEEEIVTQLGEVVVALDHPITPGYAGMLLQI
ncbi:MAG: MBL fold metallo-hydrolase [Dehalococcoidales bacterium]|nr:MAG: MBL fold metallo-hydrolase [Dehalococcoidales bacterium]